MVDFSPYINVPITYAYLFSGNGFNFLLEENETGRYSTIKESRINDAEGPGASAYFLSMYYEGSFISNNELRDTYSQYRKIDGSWVPKQFVDSFLKHNELLIIFIQSGSNTGGWLTICIIVDGMKYIISCSGISVYDYSKERETLYINYRTDDRTIKYMTNRGKYTEK